MAMNKDTVDIINAIANHNMQRARMAALAVELDTQGGVRSEK